MTDRLRLAAGAGLWLLSSLAIALGCDVAAAPGFGDLVRVYEPVTGTSVSARADGLPPGSELLHDGHLFRVAPDGLQDVGRVDPVALAAADAAVTEVDAVREPAAGSWVLVLADDASAARHARPGEVSPGTRLAFQGRVYEALGVERVEAVRPTGEALGRVVQTFVRTADAVVDVEVGYPDGGRDRLTGTPEHPFWVPSVQDYVALEDLEVGTVLRTWGGSEATVLGLTWKHGDVEVYDIEVEGLHNFFVRGPGSDAPGVLVHNSTGPEYVYRGGSRTPDNMTPRPGKDTDGLSTWTTAEAAAGPGGKAQKIDTSKLEGVCMDCRPDGHVSLHAGSPEATAEWAATRGTGEVHPLTQEVLDAVQETVKVPK